VAGKGIVLRADKMADLEFWEPFFGSFFGRTKNEQYLLHQTAFGYDPI
jgi:hypothetical protein